MIPKAHAGLIGFLREERMQKVWFWTILGTETFLKNLNSVPKMVQTKLFASAPPPRSRLDRHMLLGSCRVLKTF